MFSDLLNWAIRTGRINASERIRWALALIDDPVANETRLRSAVAGTASTTVLAAAAAEPPPPRVSPQPRQPTTAPPTPESTHPWLVDVPPPAGRPPTLFAAGELPPVTASGIDPRLLLDVPWQARRAVARADQVEAYRLLERYSGEEGATRAELDSSGNGPLAADVREYMGEYSRWASTPGS